MKYTEEQLKRALVEVLPERIALTKVRSLAFWIDNDDQPYVTPHEWPAIVGMVEDKLSEDQLICYAHKLSVASFALQKQSIVAKWQIRTEALINIGILKL